MRKSWPFLVVLLILILPIALRPRRNLLAKTDRTLIIITAHNEAIRYEFGRAFADYFRRKTAETVHIDWRTSGGISEISRYLASEYAGAFENFWIHNLHKKWNAEVANSFDNPAISPNATASDRRSAARRAFLDSNTSCKIDILFGGGSFDFNQHAVAGRTVDCGAIRAYPELFNQRTIPQSLGGEQYWDPQGRWIGACLASFGICYNLDSLTRLGIKRETNQWSDLADPLLFDQVALADPTKSGVAAKIYEMVIQQQIAAALAKNRKDESAAIARGWNEAMFLLREIGGNARYFADSGMKVPLDVATGDAAAGMCIDFYGRFESEAANAGGLRRRMYFVAPHGGTSVSVDGIAILRGAPHPELAREFIEWVISPEAQKLWNWKVGAPGGPQRYALRRLPILPQLYDTQFDRFRSDPEVKPYADAKSFGYEPKWTAHLFRAIGFVIKVMCIDTHDELRDAWRDLNAAHNPPAANAQFVDLREVDYGNVDKLIAPALRSGSKEDELRLSDELINRLRQRYREVSQLARERK